MFELTGDDIALLGDEDLRTLVARLCESELRNCGISPDCVTWGGNQKAADGGVDVRVSLPSQVDPAGFIPRSETGYQVKAEDTPASKIIAEMRPDGALRPSIRQLAERSGAYIMVSSKGSTADTPLQNRREAMAEAIQDLPYPSRLKIDFYDRQRLEMWLRGHSGTTLWVRERIGKPIQGWSSYGEWSFHPEAAGSDYLVDDQLRFKARGQSRDVSVVDGINQIRSALRSPSGVVRLVGLSGLGKTRLAEALFDARVGEQSLVTSLIANDFNVLVEGAADKPLLEGGFKKFLGAESARIVVNGSIAESQMVLPNFYQRSGLPYAIYLDKDDGGRKLRDKLVANGIPADRIVYAGDVINRDCDFELEDTVGTAYHDAVRAVYPQLEVVPPDPTKGKSSKYYEKALKDAHGIGFNKPRVADEVKPSIRGWIEKLESRGS